ncbi:MAG TPA: hypothetical protein ENK96_02150 [Desulfobulbaceae bacterium]|nr:hypothetical protein [Desulfobulbaceae bacterium]
MFSRTRLLPMSTLPMRYIPVLGICMLLLFSCPARAWNGKVLKVLSGDTIVVSWKDQSRTVKLYGIDCPETQTGPGQKARAFTRAKAKAKTAKINPMTRDEQGRTVAQVFMNGQSLNAFIVRSGYGLVNRKQCTVPSCEDWLRYERYAYKRHKGIWAKL